MKIFFMVLFSFSASAAGTGRIYSLGFGLNSIESNDDSIESVDGGTFVRLSHEGLLAKNLLYVVGAGYYKNSLNVNYEYEGRNTTTSINDFYAASSRFEGRLGLKYNIRPWFYFGIGGVAGDYRIEYERDDYIDESSDTENFIKSENINYYGYYSEIGFMHVYKNLGFRLGGEFSSLSSADELDTLGDSSPNFSESKIYVEILWKN